MVTPTPSLEPVRPDDLEQVVDGTRAIAGLIAESLVALEPSVTMPQWRVLVLVGAEDCNVSAVAEDLGVHMSNATRICDRLVTAGLLRRRPDPTDRRRVRLQLTTGGRSLYDQGMSFRQERLEAAMRLMAPEERVALARGLAALGPALRGSRPAHRDG